MSGFDFDPDESFELALFRAAEAQKEAGHHFLAVVTAQAAVEAVAQSVFTTLFGINLPRSLETMNELLPDRSFIAKGTRMLWQELTGESITDDKALWKRYYKHVIERRNPAVHGSIFGFPTGEPITKEDAEASIEATRAMTTYLLATVRRVIDELVTDEGRMAEQDQWRALRLLSSRPATPASERISRVIRELREERSLSVEELAAATRFHPDSIARIESGLTEPSPTMLVTLANALGTSTAALIERAGLDSIRDDHQ